MVHFGPFWPEEVHFAPFRSANRTLAIPEKFQARLKISSEMHYFFNLWALREGFGHFPAKQNGWLLVFLLRDRHSLLESS